MTKMTNLDLERVRNWVIFTLVMFVGSIAGILFFHHPEEVLERALVKGIEIEKETFAYPYNKARFLKQAVMRSKSKIELSFPYNSNGWKASFGLTHGDWTIEYRIVLIDLSDEWVREDSLPANSQIILNYEVREMDGTFVGAEFWIDWGQDGNWNEIMTSPGNGIYNFVPAEVNDIGRIWPKRWEEFRKALTNHL